MIDDLLRALPIREFYVRRGTYAACGDGPIHMYLDLEPGEADGIELVFDPAGLPDWAEDIQEAAEWLITDEFLAGMRLEFRDRCGATPSIRLVVRRFNGSLVDMNESASRRAGKYVADKLIRLAADPSLVTALDDRAGLQSLRHALPITGVSAHAGEVAAVVDLVPGTGYVIESVIDAAGLPDWAGGPEDVARELQEICAGISMTLRRRFHTEPPMRVVVHRLRTGPTDGNTDVRRVLGRLIVEQAFRSAGIPLILG